MRIVLTVACVHKMGGTEKATLDLANLLSSDPKNEVIILSLYKNLSNLETQLTTQINNRIVIKYADSKSTYLSRNYKYYKLKEIISVKKIRNIIENMNPDVVIHSQIEHVKRVRNAKNLSIIHTSYRACKNSKYTMFLLKKRLKELDSIIFLNELDANSFNQDFAVEKAKFIPNSTSLTIKQRTTLKNKQMIFLGRLDNDVKQIDHLINAVTLLEQNNTLNGWKLHIYGEGKDKEYLQAYIEEKNMQHCIELKGQTNNVEETLAKYDIMLLSSKYEGMPMVLLEAGSSGLALISYNCSPAIKTIILDSYNGYIIEKDNKVLFAEKLYELIINDELRQSMGEKNLLHMQKNFNHKKILEKWSGFFYE